MLLIKCVTKCLPIKIVQNISTLVFTPISTFKTGQLWVIKNVRNLKLSVPSNGCISCCYQCLSNQKSIHANL